MEGDIQAPVIFKLGRPSFPCILLPQDVYLSGKIMSTPLNLLFWGDGDVDIPSIVLSLAVKRTLELSLKNLFLLILYPLV